MKLCVLRENTICTECNECQRCDLDLQKICDNCCKCIDSDEQQAFARIQVDDIVTEAQEDYLNAYFSQEDAIEGEDEDFSEDIPYEKPDPVLLAEWENKLHDLEVEQP